MKQKIAIVGMPCSGSTLFFNLLRLCIEHNGLKVVSCVRNVKEPKKNEVVIYKGHKYKTSIDNWAEIILTTKRDVRDAVASTCKKQGHRNCTEKTVELLAYHNIWKEKSNFEFVYEDFKSRPLTVVKDLLNIVGLNQTDAVSQKIIDQAEAIKERNDLPSARNINNPVYKEILLHKGQITSDGKIGSFRDFFTAKELDQVHDQCVDWLLENGYEI